MHPENEAAVTRIVTGLRWLVRALAKDNREASKQFGLTASQSAVLRALRASGPLSSRQLARNLHVTPGNITGIVDRLESKSLITRERNPRDRRVVFLALTSAGQALAAQLPDPVETKLIAGLGDLSPEEAHAVDEAMGRIFDIVEANPTEGHHSLTDITDHPPHLGEEHGSAHEG